MHGRILYLQFTNPAGYPPLEHGSRILADRGWSVTFLGTGAFGGASGLSMPHHANIRSYRMPYLHSRVLRRIAYLAYCLWATVAGAALRPRWVYASDPLSCLPALLVSRITGAAVVYHEHDSPGRVEMCPKSRSTTLVARCRIRIARTARSCVLPNSERVRSFISNTKATSRVVCVWNCPRAAEATVERDPSGDRTIVFYHGSLNRERLPFSVLKAMSSLPARVCMQFAGYGTAGSPRYAEEFLAEANRLGLGDRVSYLGARNRAELMEICRRATVGLSLIPMESPDANMRAMTGASNKPFDYLACGLALLVSDLAEWRAAFAEPGYARTCDPSNADSIAAELAWFDAHPVETARMGERGRQRIREEWNYERQFAPVLSEIERR